MNKIFSNESKVIPSINFFSFCEISGSSPSKKLVVEDIDISFHFFKTNTSNKVHIVDIEITKFHFAQISKNEENKEKQHKATPFGRWILEHLFYIFFVLFIKSAKITIKDIEFQVKNSTTSIHSIIFDWIIIPEIKTLKADLQITELYLSKGPLSIRIPEIQVKTTSSMNSLKYLLGSQLSVFVDTISKVNLNYDDGLITTEQFTMSCVVPQEQEAVSNVQISPLKIHLTKLDLHTKQINFEINDIQYTNGRISTGVINSTRNSSHLFSVKSLELENKHLILEDFELTVCSTLLIDKSLLTRFLNHSKSSPKKTSTTTTTKQSDNSFIVTSKQISKIKYCLHDMHQYEFLFKSFQLKNKIISSKHLIVNQISPPVIHRFFEGSRVRINFAKPNFGIICTNCEMFLTNSFPQQSMIFEFFGMNSFMSKQRRGPPLANRKELPPTSKIFSLESEAFKVSLKENELCQSISKAFEAKRSAMEGLMMRQNRAIQIISAKKRIKFNQNIFEQKSNELLFNLYKECFNQMPKNNEKEDLIAINTKNFKFIMDGPAIKNFNEGLNKIKEILPEVNEEEIGKISGGKITLNSSLFEISMGKVTKLLTFVDFNNTGYFLKGGPIGKLREDFKHVRITCDNGKTVFNVPSLATKSVSFIELHSNSKEIVFKKSPAFKEADQNRKIGMKRFQLKKYVFQRLRLFDNYRINYRFKFDLHANNFEVGYLTNENVYTNFPPLKFQLINLNTIYNGKDFNITSDMINIKILHNLDYKFIGSLPYPNIYMNIKSFNPNQTKPRPVFIKYNSYRMPDPTYDPYYEYRTHTYSIQFNVTFPEANNYAIFNLDYLNDLLNTFSKKPIMNGYVNPVQFFVNNNLNPKLYGIEANITFPHFNILLNQGSFLVRTKGEPINFRLTSKNQLKLSAKSSKFKILTTFNEQALLKLKLINLKFDLNEGYIIVIVSDLISEIHSRIFKCINNINIKLPETNTPKVTKETYLSSQINNEIDLQIQFYKNSFAFAIETMILRICFDDENRIIQSNSRTVSYQQKLDDNNNKLHSVMISSINFITSNSVPLFSLELFEYQFAKASNYQIQIINNKIISINPTEEDFCIFIPTIKHYYFKFQENKKLKIPNKMKNLIKTLNIKLEKINLRLLMEDKTVIASLNANKIIIDLIQKQDKSETMSIIINQIIARDEQSSDVFSMIFETQKEKFLTVNLNKAYSIMKCPVFQKIDINVTPFVIRINMPFFKRLIKYFPSSDELRMLDILDEEDEMDEQNDLEDEMINALNETAADIQTQNNQNIFFCQNFQFHPFRAGICVRRKDQGLLSEFLDRGFSYPGFHYYDLFGTKERLTRIVKKNLKWAIVKSLSSLLFKKKKRTQKITNNNATMDEKKQ